MFTPKKLTSLVIFFALLGPASVSTASAGRVVFNEIAWMGTQANSSDEWLELYNNADQRIDLTGWKIYENNGQTLLVNLSGGINAHSYYLIERSDDKTVLNIEASQKPTSWGGSGLNNNGENLQLRDADNQIIDELDCSKKWFTGKASPDYKSMERKDSTAPTNDTNNWSSNDGSTIAGQDVKGNPINGTPLSRNSNAAAPIQEVAPPEIEATPVSQPPQTSDLFQSEQQPQPTQTPKSKQPLPTPTTNEPVNNSTSYQLSEVTPVRVEPIDDKKNKPANIAISSATEMDQPAVSSSATIPNPLVTSLSAAASLPLINAVTKPGEPVNDSNTIQVDNQSTIDQSEKAPITSQDKVDEKQSNESKLIDWPLLTVLILALSTGLGLVYYRKQANR